MICFEKNRVGHVQSCEGNEVAYPITLHSSLASNTLVYARHLL
jgi:hypothetical protein